MLSRELLIMLFRSIFRDYGSYLMVKNLHKTILMLTDVFVYYWKHFSLQWELVRTRDKGRQLVIFLITGVKFSSYWTLRFASIRYLNWKTYACLIWTQSTKRLYPILESNLRNIETSTKAVQQLATIVL